MGRILLTSIKHDFETIVNLIAPVQSINTAGTASGLNYAAFKKINIEHQNVLSLPEAVIIGTGTYFFYDDGCAGREALHRIWDMFSQGVKLEDIRAQIYGFYAFCILTEARAYVFTDPLNLYKICYYQQGERFLLTNTYYHIAKVVKTKVSRENMLEEIFCGQIADNSTPYEGVKRLLGDECIIYENDSHESKLITLQQSDEISNECIVEKIKKHNRFFKRNYPHVNIMLTGGSDTRLVVSILHSLGVKMSGYYMHGKTSITSSRPMDCQVAKQVAHLVEADFHELTVDELQKDNPSNDIQRLHAFGEYYMEYAGTDFFSALKGSLTHYAVETGCTGEYWNPLELAADGKKKTLDEWLKAQFGICHEAGLVNEQEEIVEAIHSKWLRHCRQLHLNEQNLSYHDICQLDELRRYKSDTVIGNLLNFYCYHAGVLAQEYMWRGARQYSLDDKLDNKLKIWLTRTFLEKAYSIPLFSHTKLYDYHEEDSTLRPRQAYILFLRRWYIKLFGNTNANNLAHKIYRCLLRDKKGLDDTDSDELLRKKILDLKTFVPPLGYKRMDVRSLFLYASMHKLAEDVQV